ncbi:hypothetical protein E2562_022941 [Oryza meyeriana var. granulata]|uniref:Uncharacterized protein n=1 Tax=Oryza meyeriana var. granulata TaxID=110450 RepID=A0A6G1D8N5_9ORYZ|nr:hypothetical protein E2562_022941 [Oryza meyeriana var. granulata]
MPRLSLFLRPLPATSAVRSKRERQSIGPAAWRKMMPTTSLGRSPPTAWYERWRERGGWIGGGEAAPST